MTVGFLQPDRGTGGIRAHADRLARLAEEAGADVLVEDVSIGPDPVRGIARTWRRAAGLRRTDAVEVQHNDRSWGRRWSGALTAVGTAVVLRRRAIVTFHDVYLDLPVPGGRVAGVRRALRPERIALRAWAQLAGACVVSSEAERDRLAAITGRTAVVVPLPVEVRSLPDRASARAQLGLGPEPLVAVLGYVHPRKGHALVLDALAALPADTRVAFVGGAPPSGSAHLDALRRRIDELGVADRVVLTGFVDDAELDRWLAATDIGACPFERVSASASLATWISARVPIVVSDVPVADEVRRVAEGAVTTFAPHTPDAFAAAVVRARASSASSRAALDAVAAAWSGAATWRRHADVVAGVRAARAGRGVRWARRGRRRRRS
jgi:glycosyltransferase involved in cell wall biosynthesis